MKALTPDCGVTELQATVRALELELADTNRGLVALALELEQRVDERTTELRTAHAELKATNSELMQITLELEDRVAHRTRELHALNESLHASEERFRLAAECSNDIVYEWDLQQRVEWLGKIDEMLGYAAGEFPRTLDGWVGTLHPEDRVRVEDAIQSHLAGRASYAIEYRVRAKNGTFRWWSARGVVTRTAEGRPVRWIGTITDITEPKQASEEIQRLNTDLERRVCERTAELEAANRELEAFSYSVSHDLRAPLRSIDGFSRIVLTDFGDKLNEEGRDHLRRVRAASQRMGELIDDLLKLSRATRAELSWTTVDLSREASEIIANLQRQEPDRRVHCTIAPGLTASADRALLAAALENLLANAWKFTGRTSDARIELGRLGDEAGGAFYVRDNGAGFDATYAHKLFTPFQRLHDQTEFPGHGIGLATIQRIIQRHGGRVWAEGHVDAGASFYFTLPRKPCAS